ncbi:MAG: pyridoxal-phosphate dependent enzyme [Deltaproteobacteria bacterium]|uniref:Pyridoxal-phosphate dependent enzyme n=1 Tax=Candidatus Zymogenus saltonus TaxID=2844893 RepID=A0A9D8PNQ6_9DELT|nr:pyridoxal-phosphate dependent enzyme [Candidatus Zymogenus saltonus]
MKANVIGNERPWIFSEYPELKGKISFKSYGDYPSGVEHLKSLSKVIGSEVYIKRDDRASSIYGGNKCRMMEFIIPDALDRKRKSLVTWGAIGSNQVLSSVIFGNQAGFDDITAIHNVQPYHPYVKRNLLISTSLGVKQLLGGNDLLLILKLFYTYIKKKITGKRPYLIPLVGSAPISVLSYFDAALELRRQIDGGICPRPDYIFVTVGTGGTAAGLILGSMVFGGIGEVVGVRTVENSFVSERIIAWEINRTLKFLKRLGVDLKIGKVKAEEINILHDYLGEGYAESTPEGSEAIKLLKELEDIDLDVTYTGKTMAAMLDMAREKKEKRFLFWHTLNTVDITRYTDKLPDVSEAPEPFHKHLR